MILEAKYGRIVLWGAKVNGTTITAALGYFAPNIINPIATVSVRGKADTYRIKLIPQVLNKSRPSTGSQLVLPVVE